jgi:hypothetical protein
MENSQREKQRRSYNTMRTVYNITMGIIILGIGAGILLNEKFGWIDFSQNNPIMIYAFSGLCFLYGGFRLYRGFKKDY